MTPESEQISELQREWRVSVMSSIKSTEAKVDTLLSQMNDMRVQYVRAGQFEEALKRIGCLEGDKQKVIGAMVLLNALGALVLYLIGKFWK